MNKGSSKRRSLAADDAIRPSDPQQLNPSTTRLDSLRAGAVYSLLVFGIGFVLGTIRVLFVVPRAGELVGVLIELPIILTMAWIVCRWVIVKMQLPGRMLPRLAMSVCAFSLLIAAETLLAVWLFGNSVAAYCESFKTPQGVIGLGGQITFGLFPVVQLLVDSRR